MGEAYVGVADDINSLYWNPAGLSLLTGKQVTFTHNTWMQGVNYEYLAYGQSLCDLGSIGFSIAYLGVEPMQITNAAGVATGGSVDASDLMVGVAYAKAIGSLSIGATLKVLQERLAYNSAVGIGADIGILKKFEGIENLALGVNIQNIGTPLVFIDPLKASLMPLNIKAGGSCKLSENIVLALDINYAPLDARFSVNIGTELWCNKVLALRFGYRTGQLSDIDALAGITAGFGFRWEGCGIDYAFVPYGNMGQTHRISLVAEFGSAIKLAENSRMQMATPRVKADVKGKKVLLFWAPSEEENVAGYKIYVRKSLEENYRWIGVKPVSEAHYVFNAEPGTTYYIVVTAFSTDYPTIETPFTNEISVTPADVLALK
ncbi:hypothetical protein COY52_05820 [Candidatus Desantisbacteria bacterium CG_4_10_14_0_8_um_filter_48_22]|uniref:Fibronectin type-III domain-containing protein n=1 Tax=Candidatus Desantisbacteria bacterium CG_4_10_14_0_8_um_filter_48_22 TaxID=1974543 RepID=A0A2M7SBN3_9BACT|nr:MAG: hypothetical protein AUJ67_08015 [Candidatus Desantisbacteria bacterium CG1_02_49_89]PIV55129.1 MAG: hypothetical protein COS16_08260 [Candidatus Desantisbacteria bacterium CG02_land_8_20_14_3_00_49_13]PIZ16889.1 MAG: hypothetical protein COY52_05820 [Candidatus Desantisbacteria bacterium CG_4_10_14_0_8_um_filter_48_22]